MKRVNYVTLGVSDLEASRAFYEGLFDWQPHGEDTSNIVFYNQGGWILALYPRDKLAEDATVAPEGSGFPGVTLSHNVAVKEQVAAMLEKAVSLGAKLVKPAQDVFWGGHSGYFQSPDGHYWEVAFNPFTGVLEDGCLDLPEV